MVATLSLLSDEKLVYGGIFDLKELYTHLYNWLTWHKYDLEEKKYKEKIKPTGKDIEIEWSATRDIDEYSKFELKAKWYVFGLTEVEVAKDGAKVKRNKGDVEIWVTANLVTDRQDRWETSPHLKFLKSFYERYLYKGTIDRLKTQVWKEGWDFFNEIKAFLNLYKYT